VIPGDSPGGHRPSSTTVPASAGGRWRVHLPPAGLAAARRSHQHRRSSAHRRHGRRWGGPGLGGRTGRPGSLSTAGVHRLMADATPRRAPIA